MDFAATPTATLPAGHRAALAERLQALHLEAERAGRARCLRRRGRAEALLWAAPERRIVRRVFVEGTRASEVRVLLGAAGEALAWWQRTAGGAPAARRRPLPAALEGMRHLTLITIDGSAWHDLGVQPVIDELAALSGRDPGRPATVPVPATTAPRDAAAHPSAVLAVLPAVLVPVLPTFDWSLTMTTFAARHFATTATFALAAAATVLLASNASAQSAIPPNDWLNGALKSAAVQPAAAPAPVSRVVVREQLAKGAPSPFADSLPSRGSVHDTRFVSRLTRAEVMADAQIWRESGLAQLDAGEAPDRDSAAYRSAQSRYDALRASPYFATLVQRFGAAPERVAMAAR